MNFKSHLRVSALMLGLSLCGGLLTSAHAAPAGAAKPAKPAKASKGEKHGGMKAMVSLNLTDAQKARLKPIMEAQKEQMKALRADTTMSHKDKKAKMKALRASTQSQANAILTPDQQKKLAQIRANRKAEREAQGKDGAGKASAGKGKNKRGGAQAPAPAL